MNSFPPSGVPLLCTPADKPLLEAQNQARLLAYIQDFAAARKGPSGYLSRLYTEDVVLRLHALTIQGIYPCAGTLRDAMGGVIIAGASFIPQPGHVAQNELRDLLEYARSQREHCRSEQTRINHAADCFHRFLHIHPFFGGNGRVARAFLLMLLTDMDIQIIPDEFLLYMQAYRQKYLAVLQVADSGDTTPIRRFMMRGIHDSRLALLKRLLSTSITLDAYFQAKLSSDQRRLLGPRTLTVSMSDRRFIRESNQIMKRVRRITRSLLAAFTAP